jgi:hypothetical protein
MIRNMHFITQPAAIRTPGMRVFLYALGTCMVAGCASNGSSSSAWAPGASHDSRYSRVLVVGVSASEDSRCMFENFLADQVASPSTEVIQSCDLATPVTPPTKESVARMVTATGADAVLATRLVGSQAAVQNDGSRDDRGGYYFKAEGTADATGPWGVYDLPVVYGQYENEPSLNLLEGQVTVSSKFYATRTQSLVCTITTTVKNMDTSDNTVAAVAEAIADRLRGDHLVK